MKGIISPSKLGKRTLWIPHLSEHAHVFKAILNRHGLHDVKVLPETTEQSIYLAREQLSGEQCLPCATTLGDFLQRTREKDFNPKKEAFFQGTAQGPCRYGQYIHLQRQILDRLGFKDTPLVALSSSDAYAGMGASFKKDGFIAFIAMECLYKLLWKTRPYEVHKGETDALFQKYVKELEETIETSKLIMLNTQAVLSRAVRDFSRVEARKEKRPLIGVVGEIYVRWNDFCNQDITRQIEELGGEAWIAPFSEWMEYTIEMRLLDAKCEGSSAKYRVAWVQQKYLKLVKWFLWQPVRNYLKGRFDDYASAAVNEGSRYVDVRFGGEAIITLGKAVEMMHAGASGIINVGPFACMPSTVVAQISTRLRREHNNLPFLNVSFDGNVQDSRHSMLGAFMHQCKGWKK